MCDLFPHVLFFIKLCYTDGLLPAWFLTSVCDKLCVFVADNYYSCSSLIDFPYKFLFFTGVIKISMSVLFFHSFFGSIQLENFTAFLQTLSLPVQGLWPIHWRKEGRKGRFSYLCCLQSLWLFATCLGSDRAAHGLLSGSSSAVLWLKRSFLPFHFLCTGHQRQLKRWGRCQLSLRRQLW